LQKRQGSFFSGASGSEKKEFDRFCAGQADWLDDLRALHGAFRKARNIQLAYVGYAGCTQGARRACAGAKRAGEEIRIHLFVQYQFFRQWKALREYCNDNGIELIGDIPIYITLDGADAWANPEILDLATETGAPLAVAGVPPDYFSETGQRWGNPLYRWHDEKGALREETLSWWKRRISRMKDMVDIVRIDHFRGFESFWSVPADEETAVNGEWVPGPGMPFFLWLRSELGDLPLIAEDLGVITPEVKALRDGLGLPGMKILQFAFDFNAKNEYLPHNIETPNCLLYTGSTTITYQRVVLRRSFRMRGARIDGVYRKRAVQRFSLAARAACVHVGSAAGDRPGAGRARIRP
jgi:4-alpha-glucanotransferase